MASVTQEVVKESYIEAGRPDLFNPNKVWFVTDSQFAYAAAVQGIMVRERPATILLLGMFYAESLLLAETGNSTGAIQIAGTDAVDQLPFSSLRATIRLWEKSSTLPVHTFLKNPLF